jgi:hypothetical protein
VGMKTPEQFVEQLKTLEAELATQDQAFAEAQQSFLRNCEPDGEIQIEHEGLDALEQAFKASTLAPTATSFNCIRA